MRSTFLFVGCKLIQNFNLVKASNYRKNEIHPHDTLFTLAKEAIYGVFLKIPEIQSHYYTDLLVETAVHLIIISLLCFTTLSLMLLINREKGLKNRISKALGVYLKFHFASVVVLIYLSHYTLFPCGPECTFLNALCILLLTFIYFLNEKIKTNRRFLFQNKMLNAGFFFFLLVMFLFTKKFLNFIRSFGDTLTGYSIDSLKAVEIHLSMGRNIKFNFGTEFLLGFCVYMLMIYIALMFIRPLLMKITDWLIHFFSTLGTASGSNHTRDDHNGAQRV